MTTRAKSVLALVRKLTAMETLRAKGISRLLLAVAMICLPLTAKTEESLKWITQRGGGSEIEIPAFLTESWMRALFTDGVDMGTAYEPEDYSLSLRQYRTNSNERPYVHLTELYSGISDAITYSVDRDELGVISGYSDNRIFYAMCRKSDGPNRCVDMEYATAERTFYDPIVTRIAKSFRK